MKTFHCHHKYTQQRCWFALVVVVEVAVLLTSNVFCEKAITSEILRNTRKSTGTSLPPQSSLQPPLPPSPPPLSQQQQQQAVLFSFVPSSSSPFILSSDLQTTNNSSTSTRTWQPKQQPQQPQQSQQPQKQQQQELFSIFPSSSSSATIITDTSAPHIRHLLDLLKIPTTTTIINGNGNNYQSKNADTRNSKLLKKSPTTQDDEVQCNGPYEQVYRDPTSLSTSPLPSVEEVCFPLYDGTKKCIEVRFDGADDTNENPSSSNSFDQSQKLSSPKTSEKDEIASASSPVISKLTSFNFDVINGCECVQGAIRNRITKRCEVLSPLTSNTDELQKQQQPLNERSQIVSQCNKPNEELINIAGCIPSTDDDKNYPSICLPPEMRCLCKAGFVRNLRSNDCVKLPYKNSSQLQSQYHAQPQMKSQQKLKQKQS